MQGAHKNILYATWVMVFKISLHYDKTVDLSIYENFEYAAWIGESVLKENIKVRGRVNK